MATIVLVQSARTEGRMSYEREPLMGDDVSICRATAKSRGLSGDAPIDRSSVEPHQRRVIVSIIVRPPMAPCLFNARMH